MKNIIVFFSILQLSLFICTAQINNSGLAAFYKLNGDATDASGNNNNGAIHGGITAAIDRFGNKCGALEFNGTDGYISIPGSTSLNTITSGITIAAWVKLSVKADGFWVTVCSKSDKPEENDKSPQFRFQFTKKTISFKTNCVFEWQEAFDKDQWFFWVLTYNGQDLNVYKNSNMVFSESYTRSIIPNHFPLEIGRDFPGNPEYFCGMLDDIRIYNRAINPNEIIALFKEGASASTTPCPIATVNQGAASLSGSTTITNPPSSTTISLSPSSTTITSPQGSSINTNSANPDQGKLVFNYPDTSCLPIFEKVVPISWYSKTIIVPIVYKGVDRKSIRIYAYDNIGPVDNPVFLNYNGVLQDIQEPIDVYPKNWYEPKLLTKCNFLLFKSNTPAEFEIRIDNEIVRIKCSNDSYFGILFKWE